MRRLILVNSWPPIGLAVLAMLCLFPVSGQDDFFITLWPATTLAEQGEILNYNGERIEQSSALLLTLLLGAASAVSGLDPAHIARWISLAAALVCLVGLGRWSGNSRSARPLATWLLAASAPFLYWACSGTEMSLMALLLVGWIAGLRSYAMARDRRSRRRSLFVAAGLSLLIAMNRPEGGIVCLTVLSAAWLCHVHKPRLRWFWWPPLTLAAAALALLMAWRQVYFGAFWPLPVSAKVGDGASLFSRLDDGLSYLVAWNGIGWSGLPLLLVVLGFAFSWTRGVWRRSEASSEMPTEQDPGPWLCSLIALAYLGFAVTSGGDWMEGGRFLVPITPCLAAVAAQGVSGLGRPSMRRGLAGLLIVLGITGVLAVHRHPKTRALPLWSSNQLTTPGDGNLAFPSRPWAERSNKAQLRDLVVLEFLDHLVAQASQQNLTPLSLASHQMGFVSYRLSRAHPGRLRFIDAAGLVERSLIDCRAIADRVSRNAGGLWRKGFDYNPHLKVRFLLENVYDCAAETLQPGTPNRPIDILYELGIPDQELLEQYGLTLVYVQDGTFLRRPSYTFVALRHSLVDDLGLDTLRRVKYQSVDDRMVLDQRQDGLLPDVQKGTGTPPFPKPPPAPLDSTPSVP